MSRSIFLFIVATLFIVTNLKSDNYKISLKIDTGFFERDNALVKTEIDFKKAISSDSIKLFKKDKEVACAFIPSGQFKGTLFWVLKGKTPSMTQDEFTLKFSDGEWKDAPSGAQDIIDKAKCETNIAPIPSFEVLEDGKKKTNWHGEKTPKGWSLNDMAWRYRKLPDVKSSCRVSENEVHDGQKAIELVNQLRDDKKEKDGKKTNLTGHAISPIFSLKPNTEYSFSYYVKFTEVIDNGKKSQAISASVNFLGEDKKRIYPRKYGINRLQTAYLTSRHPKEAYINKWVKVEYRKKTAPEVRYGQIWISGSFSGKAYVDNLTLKEVTKAGNPVKVKQGKIEKIK